MNRILVTAAFLLLPLPAVAQKPPLLPEKDVAALAQELSGEIAKRNLEGITRFHRQRGSQGFHSAAEIIVERARAYGLTDAQILQFPADGKIYYGTQRSRRPWDAEFAELWELANGQPAEKISSYETEPVTLAEDSESADVTAMLIDVGNGTKESDYGGKNVKGQIVLVAAQPGAVQDLAVGKFGAGGIISYAQNQKSAWSGEDENLIRWGHLESFSPNKTFAFMFSLKTAREYQARLAAGEKIQLHAVVKAGQHPGFTEVVTATIPGADPKLKNKEIAFSCHLHHQRPGANDNASGCVTILEVARTLQRLIDQKKIDRPARTLRFIWPPEIEGALTLLNAKPEFAQRIKAVVHMDMVGGNQNTKSVFHVTRGPRSLPSFVHDVAWAFGNFVNEQSYNFAAGLPAQYPLVAPEGGKEPLLALDAPYSMGSDHDVYQDSSFQIPAIYLNDWPDRYIHTNADTPSKLDPTKLKRAGFIAAATGLVLANATAADAPEIVGVMEEAALHRAAEARAQSRELPPTEAANRLRFQLVYEAQMFDSMDRFFTPPTAARSESDRFLTKLASLLPIPPTPPGSGPVYRRTHAIRGSLDAFGYDYLEAHLGHDRVAKLALLNFESPRGEGGEYAYEALNLANGKRTTSEIRDALSAIYGPVPQDAVDQFLLAAAEGGLLAIRS